MATQNFAHAFQIESRQGICVLIPKKFAVPSNVLAVPLMPCQKINDIALGFGVDLIGAIEQHGEFTQSEPRFTGTFPFQAFTIKCTGFLFGLEVAGYLSPILRPGAPPTVSRTVKKNAHGSKTTGCAHGRSSQRFTLPVFHHIHTQKGKNALIQFPKLGFLFQALAHQARNFDKLFLCFHQQLSRMGYGLSLDLTSKGFIKKSAHSIWCNSEIFSFNKTANLSSSIFPNTSSGSGNEGK
jgi:hypothetical protein